MKITIYRRIPGTHEVRKTAEHGNIPDDWGADLILERYGIRENLKVVATLDDGREWLVQGFPAIQNS
jgi:hypothetical protein